MIDLTNLLLWDADSGNWCAKTRFGEYRIERKQGHTYDTFMVTDPDGVRRLEAVELSDCEGWIKEDYLGRLQEEADELKALLSAAWKRALCAIEKYPQSPDNTPPLTKLSEEVGEVVKAAVKFREGKGTLDHVHAEVVDAMAMLIRLYIEGDKTHRLPPVMTAEGAEQ